MKVRIKNLDQFNEMLIRKGYSKIGFARAAGISQPMFVQITNGDANPSPATALKIVKTLEAEFDDIFEIVKRGRKQVV